MVVSGLLSLLYTIGLVLALFDPHRPQKLISVGSLMSICGCLVLATVVLLVKRYYVACVLGACILGVVVGLIGQTLLWGYNVNPHHILDCWWLVFAGMTLGWRGALAVGSSTLVSHFALKLFNPASWVPLSNNLPLGVVQHENESAFVLMVLALTMTLVFVLSSCQHRIAAIERTRGDQQAVIVRMATRLAELQGTTSSEVISAAYADALTAPKQCAE